MKLTDSPAWRAHRRRQAAMARAIFLDLAAIMLREQTKAAGIARRLDLELDAMSRMELEHARMGGDRRARAILLVAEGKGCAGAARAVRASRGSVSAWVARYCEGGLEALHPKRGRPWPKKRGGR